MGEGRPRQNEAVFILIFASVLPHLCQGVAGFLDKVVFNVNPSHPLITQDLGKSDEVLNINTCFECTHGLTREETYQLYGCTSNSTVSIISTTMFCFLI